MEWKHTQQLQRYEGEYKMIHTNDKRKLLELSNTSAQMTISDFDSMMEGVVKICDRNNVPWQHLHMPDLFSGTSLNIVCILRVGKTRPVSRSCTEQELIIHEQLSFIPRDRLKD